MGKPTGFLEYRRQTPKEKEPKERILDFQEFKKHDSLEKQREQGARCMDCGVPFCQSGCTLAGMTSGCPLHNLIPEINDLVYVGNLEEAYARLTKTHCLPEFTARVCPALCEEACTCGVNFAPVATKENEYAVIENAFRKGLVKPCPPKVRTGKKIAVIGSGPAGLAAALKLNQRGHEVTVFERSDRIGGLLCYGIPNMKLDKSIIERRKKLMEEEGVQFRTNVNVGADVKAKELLKEYDRILLACGASNPRDVNVKGRDAKGIYFAVDFLSRVTKSLLDSSLEDKAFPEIKGKRVVVIGGGDTGNDCVGTSIRLGAKSVVQLEMMPEPPKERTESNPWPQWPKVLKTDYGQEEAIAVFGKDPRVYCTTVDEFIKDKDGNLKAVRTVELTAKKNENNGRVEMSPVKGSEKQMDADIVLIAAGFLGAQKYIADEFGTALNERGNVKTKDSGYETFKQKVFVAGDMRRGQSLVVWAIKEGIEAAKAVDRSLMGYTNL